MWNSCSSRKKSPGSSTLSSATLADELHPPVNDHYRRRPCTTIAYDLLYTPFQRLRPLTPHFKRRAILSLSRYYDNRSSIKLDPSNESSRVPTSGISGKYLSLVHTCHVMGMVQLYKY